MAWRIERIDSNAVNEFLSRSERRPGEQGFLEIQKLQGRTDAPTAEELLVLANAPVDRMSPALDQFVLYRCNSQNEQESEILILISGILTSIQASSSFSERHEDFTVRRGIGTNNLYKTIVKLCEAEDDYQLMSVFSRSLQWLEWKTLSIGQPHLGRVLDRAQELLLSSLREYYYHASIFVLACSLFPAGYVDSIYCLCYRCVRLMDKRPSKLAEPFFYINCSDLGKLPQYSKAIAP